jgi:hypothetical protein
VDKRFFIPSYYFMAELARDGKESAFAYPKRFGEEYASRKRGNAIMAGSARLAATQASKSLASSSRT